MRYPELPLPRRFCATALLELGRYQEAETVLAPALRLYPDDLELGITQAWIATRGRSDLRVAIEFWETLRERAPDRLEGYHGGAAALVEAARFEDADALLITALERFPAELAAALEWARLPERRQDWTVAASRWERVVARFPENPESHAGFGRSLRESGELYGAITQLRTAFRRFPDDLEIGIELAVTFGAQRDWPQALPLWESLKGRHPGNPVVAAYLTDILGAAFADQARGGGAAFTIPPALLDASPVAR